MTDQEWARISQAHNSGSGAVELPGAYDDFNTSDPRVSGLLKYSYEDADNTGVAHDNIDEILSRNHEEAMLERYAQSGFMGPTPDDMMPNPDEALLSMTPVGALKSTKSLAELFKLAAKYPRGVPAYLRKPITSKGFRKTGITTGKATPNDPIFNSMNRFDRYGEKIPRERLIDFLKKN